MAIIVPMMTGAFSSSGSRISEIAASAARIRMNGFLNVASSWSEPVRLFLVRDLVGAFGREPARGFGRGQAVFRSLQPAQRRVELVADLVRRVEGEPKLGRRRLCNAATKHHRREREK